MWKFNKRTDWGKKLVECIQSSTCFWPQQSLGKFTWQIDLYCEKKWFLEIENKSRSLHGEKIKSVIDALPWQTRMQRIARWQEQIQIKKDSTLLWFMRISILIWMPKWHCKSKRSDLLLYYHMNMKEQSWEYEWSFKCLSIYSASTCLSVS